MTMTHRGTILLETERLLLRPFSLSDAEAMFRNWASDPVVTRYLTWPAHGDVEATRAILREWIRSYDDPTTYQWAIEPRGLGEPIGGISVVGSDEDIQQITIGYVSGQPWWGRGIMTEALDRVLRFFFEEVGANRVTANHLSGNPASGRVMAKCGMTHEGTFRASTRDIYGNLQDEEFYAILAADFGSQRLA